VAFFLGPPSLQKHLLAPQHEGGPNQSQPGQLKQRQRLLPKHAIPDKDTGKGHAKNLLANLNGSLELTELFVVIHVINDASSQCSVLLEEKLINETLDSTPTKSHHLPHLP